MEHEGVSSMSCATFGTRVVSWRAFVPFCGAQQHCGSQMLLQGTIRRLVCGTRSHWLLINMWCPLVHGVTIAHVPQGICKQNSQTAVTSIDGWARSARCFGHAGQLGQRDTLWRRSFLHFRPLFCAAQSFGQGSGRTARVRGGWRPMRTSQESIF